MLMTVDELRQYIDTQEDARVLEARLQAVEQQIRGYTGNAFTLRSFGRMADIVGRRIELEEPAPYAPGDTVQVSGIYNHGLLTVKEVLSGTAFTVQGPAFDEIDVYAVKVDYPMDVKLGAANLISYDLTRRDKAGIASETISRHAVTYADQTAANTALGYPAALTGFLQPYMKARFGEGVRR